VSKDLFIHTAEKKFPMLHCPCCGVLVDGVTCLSEKDLPGPERLPTPGSLTLCMYCREILMYELNLAAASGLGLRKAQPDEIEEFRKHSPKMIHMFIRLREEMGKDSNLKNILGRRRRHNVG
jgi:hypothetical protein